MKILIIGGTGFIGRPLVDKLYRHHELFVIHRSSVPKTKAYTSIQTHRKNLPTLRSTFAKIKPEIVIDIIPYFAQDAWDVVQTFSGISQQIIALSSGDVYRAYEIFRDGLAVPDNTPATEEAPLRRNLFPYRGIEPENFLFEHYDKILVEKILLSQSKIKSVILRLGAVYGAYDSQRKLKDYIQPMIVGKEKLVIDPAKAQWRWTSVFVREVVNAIQLAVEKTGGSEHEVFNVGEQTALTQLELLMKLKELTEWKGRIEIRPNRGDKLNYQQHLLLNTDKIRSKIGYVEQHNLEQGLTETIEFETDTIRT